jgi:carbamoyltransferase
MIIIGINAYHADSSAAIFINGKLIAAIEEERFTRIKHWAGFPKLSIEFCLKHAGINLDQVDYFAIGRDSKAKLFNKLGYLFKNPLSSPGLVVERFKNGKKISSIENELSDMSTLNASFFKEKVIQVEHHRSHIASAFFASPFDKAACLSVDGSGDFSTTMLGTGIDNKIKILDSLDYPHSLGIFYSAFTQLLGFPNYGDEYKVMGMAPYGKAIFMNELEKVIALKSNGLFQLNLSYFCSGVKGNITYDDNHQPILARMFSDKMISHFGLPRSPNEPLTQNHKNLASSVQNMTEKILFHVLNHLHKRTGLDNLCLAGGVAQNSVANGKITSNTSFKNVYIPSASHDAGISIGAALYVQHQILKTKRQPTILTAHTGTSYTNEAIIELLNEKGISFTHFEDEIIFDRVTDCMINGGVVGWFSGRSEFGPRALGGRSIIADPRRKDAKEILNQKIKRREGFRPFAPSILKEYLNDFFIGGDEVPFMEKVLPIIKDRQNEIPAVTHFDGTGRVQTVDKNISPRFWALIEVFRIKTGIPILLNTSFNENEPIVNLPLEALNCFLRTEMDMLVMQNIVVSRIVLN